MVRHAWLNPVDRRVDIPPEVPASVHVLVCDDDSATRLVVTRIVAHRFGCQVSECADGAAALQFISQQAVDLLLLDLQMPVMSGIEVVETLRKNVATARQVIENVARRLAENDAPKTSPPLSDWLI